MSENNFIHTLQQRASEQKLVVLNVPFPQIFLFISARLGESPWKILIPTAILLTFLLRIIKGVVFDEAILWLFGAI